MTALRPGRGNYQSKKSINERSYIWISFTLLNYWALLFNHTHSTELCSLHYHCTYFQWVSSVENNIGIIAAFLYTVKQNICPEKIATLRQYFSNTYSSMHRRPLLAKKYDKKALWWRRHDPPKRRSGKPHASWLSDLNTVLGNCSSGHLFALFVVREETLCTRLWSSLWLVVTVACMSRSQSVDPW